MTKNAVSTESENAAISLDASHAHPITVDAAPSVRDPASQEPTKKKSKNEPKSPSKSKNENDLPLFEFSYRLVSDFEELRTTIDAWKRLAEVAIEPNAFYEPMMLLPALEHLAEQREVQVLLVEAPKRVFPSGPKVLCGLFPLVQKRTFSNLPIRCWEMWQHLYCFLHTPLIRTDCAREVLDFFFETLTEVTSGACVAHFPRFSGDGPLNRLLIDANYAAKRVVYTKDLETRAMFTRDVDAETFLKDRMSRNKRHYVQRIERRFAETGTLATSWFSASDNIDQWADDFLRLEASGWKAANGTALQSQASHAEFFRKLVKNAASENKLLLGRLEFNGQVIAMICNLLAADGGYSFKIAHDEKFDDYSPGVLMELALIRELHERGIVWMDSCASSQHPMINSLWTSRTVRQSLVISTGTRRSELAVSIMPLMRSVKNLFRKRTKAELKPVPQSNPQTSNS